MNERAFSESLAKAERSPEFLSETLALQFISEIERVMRAEGIKQKDLAHLLQKRPELVSRVLSGPHNVTLKTIAEFLVALNRTASFDFLPLANHNDAPQSEFKLVSQVFKLPTKAHRSVETQCGTAFAPANGSSFDMLAA